MASGTPVIVADGTKGIKVDASLVAKPFRDEIKAKVASMKEQGLGVCSRDFVSTAYVGVTLPEDIVYFTIRT